MTSKEIIFNNIKKNKPAPIAKPVIPDFVRYPEGDNIQHFIDNAKLAAAVPYVLNSPDDVQAKIDELFGDAKSVVSTTPRYKGNREVDTNTDPKSLEDVDLMVVESTLGIAESGSVCLTHSDVVVNALPHLTDNIVVIIKKENIKPHIIDAYRAMRDRMENYFVFLSGPSATADIEFVLVIGAQAVLTETILII